MRLREFSALQLCVVLVAVYSLQVLTGFQPGFNASQSTSWKFFVSVLGHSGVEHLANNIFFIGLFGTIYRFLTSEKIFWTTFTVSALFANLTAFIFYPQSFIIGASGGAMGLLSALAFYRPRKTGLVFGVPAPMYLVLASYILINFAGLTGSPGVAYEAHLFGIFTGGLIGLWLRRRDEETEEVETEDYGHISDWERKIREWEEKYMLD